MSGITIERDGLAIVVRRGSSIVGVFDTLRAAFAFIKQGAGR
jgi:hypothetical protein